MADVTNFETTEQERNRLRAQIDKLANFIARNIPGEPSKDEGAVDCAIRLLHPLARRQ